MSPKKWVADRVQQAFDSVDMTRVKYLTHPMARAALEDLNAAMVLNELERVSFLDPAVGEDISEMAARLEVRAHRVLAAMREAEERNESLGGVAVDKAPSNDGE